MTPAIGGGIADLLAFARELSDSPPINVSGKSLRQYLNFSAEGGIGRNCNRQAVSQGVAATGLSTGLSTLQSSRLKKLGGVRRDFVVRGTALVSLYLHQIFGKLSVRLRLRL